MTNLVRIRLHQLADRVEANPANAHATDREVARLVAAHNPSIIPPHTCPADRGCLACWMAPEDGDR